MYVPIYSYTGNIIQLCIKCFGAVWRLYIYCYGIQPLCITDVPRRFTICLRTTQTLLYPAGSDLNKSGASATRSPDPGSNVVYPPSLFYVSMPFNILFHLVIIIISISTLHLINASKTKVNIITNISML